MAEKSIFVDTNILLYAHDVDAGDKHARARDKILQAWSQDPVPSISVQVLQEFLVNLVRKGVPGRTARQTVESYLEWQIIDSDVVLFRSALELQERWKLSFWDSLILAAAQRSGATRLWSEDFTPGQNFDGIIIENPIALP